MFLRSEIFQTNEVRNARALLQSQRTIQNQPITIPNQAEINPTTLTTQQ